MKAELYLFTRKSIFITSCILLLLCAASGGLFAQSKVLTLTASSEQALIRDGKQVRINWKLEQGLSFDTYYVNTPHRNSRVVFSTNEGSVSLNTRYGQHYDLFILLNHKDTCRVRISATEEPSAMIAKTMHSKPDTIPFTMIGSRLYLKGILNGNKSIVIQFDLGAGGLVVNKLSSEKLQLKFDGSTTVSNTQGVNHTRSSSGNQLVLGNLKWNDMALIEVGNMGANEDVIVGNSLFRDKVLEIDYDRGLFIVHNQLPKLSKSYKKQLVYYEQHRPRFETKLVQNGKSYKVWALFDTGRDGTMLIGEDFTSQNNHWNQLKELQIINGRKIVRLNAKIAGREFKDIVTNAADPSKPGGRPTLFGNQILNQFNVILDNREGMIYLKPNSRMGQPYSNYSNYLLEKAK